MVCLKRWTVDYLPGFCGMGILAVAAVEAGVVGLEGELAHCCYWGDGFFGEREEKGERLLYFQEACT